MHLGKGQRKCMHNGNMVPVPIVQHNSMPFIPRSRSQYTSTTTNRYIILKSSQIFQATNQQQTFQWLLSTFNQLLSDVWLSLAEFQTLQAHFSISKTIHELFSRFKIQGSFRLALISRQAWEPRMFFFSNAIWYRETIYMAYLICLFIFINRFFRYRFIGGCRWFFCCLLLQQTKSFPSHLWHGSTVTKNNTAM